MSLADVQGTVADALSALDGVRVVTAPAEAMPLPPCVVVGMPEVDAVAAEALAERHLLAVSVRLLVAVPAPIGMSVRAGLLPLVDRVLACVLDLPYPSRVTGAVLTEEAGIPAYDLALLVWVPRPRLT